MDLTKLSRNFIVLGGIVVSGALLKQCIYKVNPGERSIIFDKFGKGIKNKVYKSGYNFYIPFKQEPIIYNIKTQTFDYRTSTGTKDMQKVNIKLKIFYQPIEEFIPKIHLQLNKNYMNKVLPAIGNEVLKAIIAKYNAEHLLKERADISSEIKKAMIQRAKSYHLILNDVSIYDLQFTQELMESIEKKQVAQQEAEKYKYVVQ